MQGAQQAEDVLELHQALRKRKPSLRILALIRQHPRSAAIVDSDGQLPIHLASINGDNESVLKALIDLHPLGLSARSRYGGLPIHQAMDNKKLTSDIILYMATKCPESLRVQDDSGDLPIHLPCFVANYTDIALRLVDLYPECLQKRGKAGRLPIHSAMMFKSMNSDVIMNLIERYPECARIATSSGHLPLHYACAWSIYENLIPRLIDLYPEGLGIMASDHHLPLHTAILSDEISGNTILNMIDSCPRVIQAKTDDGSLPIHLACGMKRLSKIIPQLVELYMNAGSLLCRDNIGKLPLHRALEDSEGNWSMDSDTVLYLIRACPQSLEVLDLSGRLPVHYACIWKEYESLIPIMHSLYPEGLLTQGVNGKCPIQDMLEFDHVEVASGSAVMLVARLCPESVRVKDDYKRVALHYACSSKYHSECIIELVDMYPEALSGWSGFRGPEYLPIHLACSNHHVNEKTIEYMATLNPDSLLTPSCNGMLPIQTRMFLFTFNWFEYYLNLMGVIRTLIRLCPESISYKSSTMEFNALECARDRDEDVYRILLNNCTDLLIPEAGLISHLRSYYYLNWKARAPTILALCLSNLTADVKNPYIEALRRIRICTTGTGHLQRVQSVYLVNILSYV